MGLIKCVFLGLIVTCVTAQSAKPKLATTVKSSAVTKNTFQKRNDAVKIEYIPIYLYSRENSLDGDYNYRYETGNGIYAEERGEILHKGTENQANSVVGSYRYTSPDGTPVEVTYTAGVDGFRAYGTHLPTSPAAPTLVKSLLSKESAPSALFSRTQLRSIDSVPASLPVAIEQQREPETVNNAAQQQNTFVAAEDQHELVKPEQIQVTAPEYQQKVVLDDRSSVEQQKSADVPLTKSSNEFYQTVGPIDGGALIKSDKYQLVQELPVLRPNGYEGVETELSKKAEQSEKAQVVLQDVVSDQKFEPYRTSQTFVAEQPQAVLKGPVNLPPQSVVQDITNDQKVEPYRASQNFIVEQPQFVLKGPINSLPQVVVQDIVSPQTEQKIEPYRSSQTFIVDQPQAALKEAANSLSQAVVEDAINPQSDQKIEPLRSVRPVVVQKPSVVSEQSQLTHVVPILSSPSIPGVLSQSNLVPALQRVPSIAGQQKGGGEVSQNLVGAQRAFLYNQPRSNNHATHINVEPQLLWFLQPNHQGRFLPFPVVPRTLEPPHY